MSEQKNRFTYRGTVHELGAVQNFNSGFHKRELVCKTTGGKYTDTQTIDDAVADDMPF